MQEHLSSLHGADLTLIPGICVSTALVLFTELRPDLARFPTAAQFSSWLNLCHHNKITGGKIISSHTGPGTHRAAQALRSATQSLYRSPSSLGQHFRRIQPLTHRRQLPCLDHRRQPRRLVVHRRPAGARRQHEQARRPHSASR